MAGFLFLIFLGVLLGPPPESEPVAAAPSPSPSASPAPTEPDVIGLALPDAEDELDDTDFTLGEVVLATAEDGSVWNRAAMLVCFQRVDGTVVDLSVVPEDTDCPDDIAAVHEWPAMADFVGGTVSEVQEWSEDAGISGVDVRSAFGDVDDPDADEAADHLVCAQSPDEATAPYRDSMVVKVHVVGPDEECPEEIGDPSPEPEPEPKPEPAPAPQPEPAPEPAPQPEPEPEAPSHVQGVHPGAFCFEHWQCGKGSSGRCPGEGIVSPFPHTCVQPLQEFIIVRGGAVGGIRHGSEL